MEVVLDEKYSTTRRLIKSEILSIECKLKKKNRNDDCFETNLFLPVKCKRLGEGGLRKKGYFKHHGNYEPVITIVTVVYNGAESLEETILSVIGQDYSNIEYIVIDGGSDDTTLDIIKKYEHAIDYWVSEKDDGIYDAMNKGISVASGEYINFINSADKLININVFLKVYEESSSLRAYCFPVVNSYSNGRRDVFTGRFTNPHQGVFYKLDVFKRIGFYESYKLISDCLYFDEMKRNNVELIYSKEPISEFDMGGVSSSFDIKRRHRLEFKKNFLMKKTLISLYRYLRAFF